MWGAREGQAMEPTGGGARAQRGKRAGSPRLKPAERELGDGETRDPEMERQGVKRTGGERQTHGQKQADAEREGERKERGRVGGDGVWDREM